MTPKRTASKRLLISMMLKVVEISSELVGRVLETFEVLPSFNRGLCSFASKSVSLACALNGHHGQPQQVLALDDSKWRSRGSMLPRFAEPMGVFGRAFCSSSEICFATASLIVTPFDELMNFWTAFWIRRFELSPSMRQENSATIIRPMQIDRIYAADKLYRGVLAWYAINRWVWLRCSWTVGHLHIIK